MADEGQSVDDMPQDLLVSALIIKSEDLIESSEARAMDNEPSHDNMS